jgi:uncharacterized protein YndB with AHSA1/START domain
MKWMVYSAIALGAVVGMIAVAGYLLPVAHEASRSAELTQPPDIVYALVSNLDGYAAWWPENQTTVAVVEATPPWKFVTRIVGETDFGGTWTMEIVPAASGSRLTITERGEVYNPIFRALAKFVFGHTSTIDSCLAAVARKLA